MAAVGSLRIRLFPIRSGDNRWYLLLFDLPLSLTNKGARPGQILALRLKLHFPDVPIPDNYEMVYVSREIDPLKASDSDRDYFKWLENITISSWAPFSVIPNQTVTKHFQFQARWDKPIYQEHCVCNLEYYSDKSNIWEEIAKYRVILSKVVWSELFTTGNSIIFPEEGDPGRHHETNPEDLHEYVFSDEPIPEGGFGAEPSFVDWPEHLLEDSH